MRIAFDATALNDPKWFPALDIILLLIEGQKHGIDPINIPLIHSSQWLANRPHSLRDIIRAAATVRSLTRRIDMSTVVVDGSAPTGGVLDFNLATAHLAPLEAITYLSGPFHIIVENEVYDGAFLIWMAKAVGFHKLLIAYRNGHFVFRHAGGKDAFPNCASVLTSGVMPRSTRIYGQAMRLWTAAFLDSDSKFPGDNPNLNLISRTEPHVMFVKLLRKRAIENYIPLRFIEDHRPEPEYRRKVSAFRRLSEDQRVYYHMKSGFRQNSFNSSRKDDFMNSSIISQDEKNLYGSITEIDFQYLSAGINTYLSDIFRSTHANSNDQEVSAADRSEILSLCESLFERF